MKKFWAVIFFAGLGVGALLLFSKYQMLQQVTKTDVIDSNKLNADTLKQGRPQHHRFVNWMIDSIAVHKSERHLFIFSKHRLVKTYNVALGLNPVGKKEVEGDFKTPEGHYYIRCKNPLSQFHKSLGISYPNEEDKELAKQLGQRPGGDIMIHGLMKVMNNAGKYHIKSNWTSGCIAVTNEEIDELFAQIKTGTPVVITP